MYDKALLYKITWYYYANDMTQQEIAEHLGISRMKVVKALNKAKSDGMIKFTIEHQALDKMNLENALIKKYGLKEILIMPSTPDKTIDNISKGAAQYIEEKVEAGSFINIGYGETVSKTVSELIYSTKKPLSFVTLSGGVSYYMTSIIAGAHKRSSEVPTPSFHVIPAPLIASSDKIAQTFLSEPAIKNIADMAELADLTLIGIGSVNENATIFKYGIASKSDLTILNMKGAAGDVLSQFYDENGEIIDSELHNKLISTKLEALEKSKNVVAAAGGMHKIKAIHAALKGRYIDVLITDEDTGKALLER